MQHYGPATNEAIRGCDILRTHLGKLRKVFKVLDICYRRLDRAACSLSGCWSEKTGVICLVMLGEEQVLQRQLVSAGNIENVSRIEIGFQSVRLDNHRFVWGS